MILKNRFTRIAVRFTWIVILTFGIGIQTGYAQIHSSIEIITNHDTLFFDREVGLQIRGLEPASETMVTISSTDAGGQSWWSQNVYLSNRYGEVDPSLQEPIRGTYSGTHSMGPFWSMIGADRFFTSSSVDVLIEVSNQNENSNKHIKWLSPRDHPSVSMERVDHSNLKANLYLPTERMAPIPAIIVLGGSGGGFNGERASLLATHGYAALDIAYFGVSGTPKHFVETVPLEYFMKAVDFLKSDPRIDTSQIAVMGKSYGAQLALLLASYEPRIHLVIAEAPSSFITGTSATYPEGPALSAWSLDGKAFPFLRKQSKGDGPVDPNQITILTSGELALEQDPTIKAAIKVERINGPVLLISGDSDGLWQSNMMAEQLIRRMKEYQFKHKIKHVSLADAGHNLGGGEEAYGIPNLPPRNRGSSSGGTLKGNSLASIQAWKEVLTFLELHFH